MKKLMFLILILTSLIFAQTEIKSDTTETETTPKTNDDYKVEKDDDSWMETWKEIEPSIRDFLSDEDDDEIEWNEDDGKKPRKKKRGYFRALGGGWDIFYMPVEFKEINKQISMLGLKEFDSEMYYHGGGGWIFLGDKYRIGGVGAEGNMTSTGAVNNGIRNKVDLKMHFGGFLIERVWHPLNKTEVSLGMVLGKSNLTMKVYKRQNAGDWNDSWINYNTNSTDGLYYDYQTKYENNYFSAMPSLGFRYNIFRIFGVGAKVGYYYGVANKDNWEINGSEIGNVPEMDLSNIFYSVNFYFGA